MSDETKTIATPFPFLLEHIESRDGFSEVWYEIIPEEEASTTTVKTGDTVRIIARVGSVRETGGYHRGNQPMPQALAPHKIFLQLDANEIYLDTRRKP